MHLNRVFVLALVASGIVVFAGADAQADLLGYYQFDDGTAGDSSGNSNDGTLNGPAAINATGGVSGGLLDLGTLGNSASASIANAATGAFGTIAANNAATVSLWIFGNASQPESDIAFGFFDSSNLRQLQSHLPWGDASATIYFDVGGGAAAGVNRIQKVEPTAANYEGQWNHYTFVKDGGQSRIYQNGTLWHSGATSASMGTITQAFIGAGLASANSYSGQIDEFAIFDTALSAQNIALLAEGAEANTLTGRRNLALLGTATQSSEGSGGVPSRAIDNNTNGVWAGGSVTHTSPTGATPVFWEVTLPGDVMLFDARLWNRTDCCGARLSDFRVTVFDESNATVFTQDYYVGSGQVGTNEYIDIPNSVVGNRVRVELIDGVNNNGDAVLSLAEVQAFGMIRNGDNFAKFGTATQSSTLSNPSNPVASKAIDGDRNGLFGGSSVTHTNNEAEPWWRVDLGVERYIDGVQLFERTDTCCVNRLANFDVRVLDANSNIVWEGLVADVPNGGNRIGVGTDFGTFGRFVEIQMNNTGSNRSLELAEVEVFAGKVQNIARNPSAVASQSTTLGGRVAGHATDGNVAGHNLSVAQNPFTHTEDTAGSWWQVHLGGLSEIENIILYNRLDAPQERLSNFRVSIEFKGVEVWGEDFFTSSGNVGELLRIDLDETVLGTHVRIALLGLNNNGDNVLSLSEVQVWGTVIPTPAALPAGLMMLTALALRRKRQ